MFFPKDTIPGTRAFSLVEVVLAMAVLSFSVLMMVALVPIGLETNKNSGAESAGVDIIKGMNADWRSVLGTTNTSPLYGLPALSGITTPVTNTFGADQTGFPTNAASPIPVYRVTYVVVPPQPGGTTNLTPYYVTTTVFWPGQGTNSVGQIQAISAIPIQ